MCDQPILSWEEFRSFPLGLQKEIGLIVIDPIDGLWIPLTPELDIPITDRLKNLAKQLHLPILTLGPLATPTHSQGDRRLTLAIWTQPN